MPTSSAISAATRSIPRRWRSSISSGCSSDSSSARTTSSTARESGSRASEYVIGDLSHLDTPAPFIAMMPQWEFLDFLRDEAAKYPTFKLEMEAPAESFIEEGGRVVGARLEGRPRTSRRPDHRRRRPRFAGPLARPAAGRNARRADGRVLVQPAQGRQSGRRPARLGPDRADGRADRPPHLLAGRLPHPQGHGRGSEGAGRGMGPRRGAAGLSGHRFVRRPLPRPTTCTCSR